MCNASLQTNNHKEARARAVKISPDVDIVPIDKICDNDKAEIWYTGTSLKLMSSECAKLAKKNRSARGLENMSAHEDFIFRQMRVADVVTVVLNEQHSQKASGILDHERIALMSSRFSESSARDARKVGKEDEKEAKKFLLAREKEGTKRASLFSRWSVVYKAGKAFKTKRQFVAKQC